MVSLIELPPEIVHTILGSVSPDDLVSVGLVCHWLHNCLQHNASLYRAVYCNYFDVPPTKDVDWERETHDYLRLKSICDSQTPNKSELPFVHRTVKRLLQRSSRIKRHDSDTLFSHRPFRNAQRLADLFDAQSNRAAFLCRSFLYERRRNWTRALPLPDAPEVVAEHQMSAELHSLFGSVVLTTGTDNPVEDLDAPSPYAYAASKVYDMRENSRGSRWGPFVADGSCRVDWEKVEAILIVIRFNVRSKGLFKFPILHKYWDNAFVGSWPESYMPMIRDISPLPNDSSPLDLEDPYGVTGTWMRIVCFLDYSDFFRFNFPLVDRLPINMPRPALNQGEELRLVIMKLHVSRIDPPGEDDHPDFPVVHFEGSSHSMDNPWDDNANSELRGDVHWTTMSLFGGQPRWRSESVQIGGLRSGRGVIGNWFDTNFDPQGPCGPTAFWKLHEKKTSGQRSGGQIEAFSYLLANAISNDINIVININQNFANFGNGDNGDDDDDEEDDSDYQDNGSEHGEEGEEVEEVDEGEEGDEGDESEEIEEDNEGEAGGSSGHGDADGGGVEPDVGGNAGNAGNAADAADADNNPTELAHPAEAHSENGGVVEAATRDDP
ncbi:f-box domain protein, cyclin-like protein [Niveomyces insectorum RCEF 264]|uniref:F-box domain protein, cyclin-like protein n=1 Tax=Niveomyces insectorum RCEF 264 TaxID=1081102 RepID=A0A168A8X6_9HYPO|nr:f-box domain protein, cyclin-like protein [Niveomyces insectorum RCEF 264]